MFYKLQDVAEVYRSRSVGRFSKIGVEMVSTEISDFTPCAHVQSNILHIKYAKRIDD